MELIFAIIGGLIVGIGAGLLPALPVFTGPMILYYFVNEQYALLSLLVFWMTSYCGTQYFGSIATITTGIPGEESSTIYLKDLHTINPYQKLLLLYETALGSFIASITALLFIWFLLRFANPDIFPYLLSLEVQLLVFGLALLSFLVTSSQKIAVFFLICFGLAIGPKQNYSLPNVWYDLTQVFNGYTLYMVILGTIIIPSIFTESNPNTTSHVGHKKLPRGISNPFVYLRGTLIGLLAGLIPGPSASVATSYAYRFEKNKFHKIVSAETANNAAVITCCIPFFLLGIPINSNTLIMSNVMDLYSINIIEEITKHIDMLIPIMIGVSCIYFFLSTRLIDQYARIVRSLHGKMRWIMLIILLFLISMDLSYSEITWDRYFALLTGFTFLGFILNYTQINAIPFLFAIILSDKIVWLVTQSIRIYL